MAELTKQHKNRTAFIFKIQPNPVATNCLCNQLITPSLAVPPASFSLAGDWRYGGGMEDINIKEKGKERRPKTKEKEKKKKTREGGK